MLYYPLRPYCALLHTGSYVAPETGYRDFRRRVGERDRALRSQLGVFVAFCEDPTGEWSSHSDMAGDLVAAYSPSLYAVVARYTLASGPPPRLRQEAALGHAKFGRVQGRALSDVLWR